MSDLIKRQEVIEAFTEMNRMGLSERDIIHDFETMPSADAVEVVRCKDCAYSEGFPWSACPMLGIVKLKDDDFCSRGERRTDG